MYRSYVGNKGFLWMIFALIFAISMTGCISTETAEEDPDTTKNNNSGGNEVPIERNVTGTVAVGSPVAGTVTFMDADGNTSSTDSNADGSYTHNLEGRPGPYLIRVQPADSSLPVMYSYATGAGVANITPFTTLALFLAYRTDLQTAFENWLTTLSSWDRAKLEQALAKINANFETDLLNAGVDPKLYDFFTAPFTADHTGIDAVLDNYDVTVDASSNSYEITDSSGQPVAFDEDVDTTNYYIGAWFIPDDASLWRWTWVSVVNGEESRSVVEDVPSYGIPWNQERFREVFWDTLANYPKQTITCEGDVRVSCEITYQVKQLEADYTVTGNGEVGTVVNASAAYSWSVTGWIQQLGQPRQDIDELYTWSYSWTWERTS